ncbi:Sodium/calcium exchanger protein-domain-containing protein [Linnemannia elongata]|nr:Sodium/calcium exchanger protein-domain-containing protein [Linnemannia elongata]
MTSIGAKRFYALMAIFSFTQVIVRLWPKHHIRSSSITHGSQLFKRDDPADDMCESVWDHSDRCAYVDEFCSDHQAGLINYMHLYFCNLDHMHALALIIMGAWMIFLFGLIGVAASDFFCPNLNTISKKLHLSESMAGVTFLAFGNASPDIFSTFSAVGAGSGTLAVGEVVGASSFITSIVIGSMAIVKPFKVSKGPFLRDMIFFTGCIIFILYMVLDRKITFVQSVILIAAYVIYVALVVFGNWKQQRQESRIHTTDSETGSEYSEDSAHIETLPQQPELMSINHIQHVDIIMSPIDQHLAVAPLSTCAKPSSSFKSKSKCPAIVVDPGYLAASLYPSSAGPLSSKGSLRSSAKSLAPSPLYEGPSQNPSYAQLQQVMLHHSLILPDMGDPINRPRSPVFQSATDVNTLDGMKKRHWAALFLNDWIKPVYFPTLMGWKDKSVFMKILAVGSIPIVLLLTLTLPVVDLKEDNDTLIGSQSDGTPIESNATSPDDGSNLYNGWCQGATMVQMIVAPVFITAVVTSAAGENHLVPVLAALGVGILMSATVFFLSTETKPPKFYEAFAFVGFLVAMTWIFVIANEVVGILQAVGLILGVSDAILGLTVFAMGNSLGDLVSNITIAKMGFPQMAFSACFGGPLLNMLLGLGISGTYVTLSTDAHIPLQLSPTLLVSLGAILLTMVGAMVVVPRSGYMLSRWWGIFLVGVYLVSMVVNVLLEIKLGPK